METKRHTVESVYRLIENMVGGGLNKIEDVISFGTKTSPVGKILVCWMADVGAIRHAAQIGADLMVVHESPFFPYNVTMDGGVPEFMSWHSNQNRIKLMAQNGISLIRMHWPLDRYSIFEEFTKTIGLGGPGATPAPYHMIFEVVPLPYGDLIARVKRALGLPAVRVSNGDLHRIVRRVGVAWGGLGLFVNVNYVQELLNLGCDVLIAGETDNYGIRFAIDAGVDMIEVGHDVSENLGIRRFARDLGETLAGIPVEFYENQSPFVFM